MKDKLENKKKRTSATAVIPTTKLLRIIKTRHNKSMRTTIGNAFL